MTTYSVDYYGTQYLPLLQETQLLPSVVVTEQQSLVVVKKLLAIAVSTITYLRGLFPEKAYGSKYVEGMEDLPLKTLFFVCLVCLFLHGVVIALQNVFIQNRR